MKKKNPLALAIRCYRTWRSFRVYPGVYSARDACKYLSFVLQPNRLTEWQMRRFIHKELEIRVLPENVREIKLRRNGLIFYWLGEVSGGTAGGILQEIDPTNPHYYNTPPVYLSPSSLVLDVGACEGLFALRITAHGQAARVICFEPAPRTASFLSRAAEANGVAERINVEICAVGRNSLQVFCTNSGVPESNRIVTEAGPGTLQVHQVALDDYCAERRIKLGAQDLIKVDAEGADVDVIQGAERLIREFSPQIAVTTYHHPAHAEMLIKFLRSVQPRYRLRLKGLALWETIKVPRPVLLQAALPEAEGLKNVTSAARA